MRQSHIAELENLLEESTIVYGLEPDAAGCGT